MADRITYVGLDVHKESIVVAVASGGLRGEVREYGRIANTATALDRLLRKLGSDGMTLRFCYEAGPCGYGIQRRLSAQGHECAVVAPSLIPKRAGDRVKTDRRDAASLAKLHRAVRRFSGKGPTSTLPLGLRVKPASRAKIAYLRRAVVALPVAARIAAFAFGQRLPFDLSDCRLGRRLSRRQGWPVLRSHGLFTNRRFGAA